MGAIYKILDILVKYVVVLVNVTFVRISYAILTKMEHVSYNYKVLMVEI